LRRQPEKAEARAHRALPTTWVDHRIPIEDSVGALVELQRDGKIRHIGESNVSERELARARAVAKIVSVQNCYNLRDRSSDGLIDMCAGGGIAFIPWYPLAAGRLASPNSPLVRIAQSHGATPSQIALAWLLQRSPPCLRGLEAADGEPGAPQHS
jgi:aryl-alcohol dehydrogenase-like predicted oxidoreductase